MFTINTVIPAKAGIQFHPLIDFNGNQINELDSRCCGNDGVGHG